MMYSSTRPVNGNLGQNSGGGYRQATMNKLVMTNRINGQMNQTGPAVSYRVPQPRFDTVKNFDKQGEHAQNRGFVGMNNFAGKSGYQNGLREKESSTYNGPSTSNTGFQRNDQNMNMVSNRNQQLLQESSTYNGPSTSKAGFQRIDQNMNIVSNRNQQLIQHDGDTSKNKLGLLGMPKVSASLNTPRSNASNKVSQNIDDQLKMKRSGETEREKLCILTGTVERTIKYGKIFQNQFCYFQVIGSVVSIADGKVQFEKIMFLRDKKGPVLQLVYYSNATHINIEDFHLGQNLRAVGRMVGPNVMSAIAIRAATNEEVELLPRVCCISDYAVSSLCGDGPN